MAWNFESFRLETFCLCIYFYRNGKGSCVEDNDSHVFAVLLHVSFAHRVLQDIMPGKRMEVGGWNDGEKQMGIENAALGYLS